MSRELGIKPHEWRRREQARRSYALDLSHLKDISSGHTKAITALDYDSSDGRLYVHHTFVLLCNFANIKFLKPLSLPISLLSASLDGIIGLYDMIKTYGVGKQTFNTLASVTRFGQSSIALSAHHSLTSSL